MVGATAAVCATCGGLKGTSGVVTDVVAFFLICHDRPPPEPKLRHSFDLRPLQPPFTFDRWNGSALAIAPNPPPRPSFP
jgi:hypothetical protein